MKRVAELDSIRGLASLAILLHHLGFKTGVREFAVDLFFVLSGYLITRIVLQNRGEDGFLLNFYLRRGLRIWPIYYLTILVLVPIGLLVFHPCNLEGLPYYLTYTQYTYIYFNAKPPEFDLPLYHTWTLAIEEQFYLIWPALILLAGGRRVIPLALAGLLATFAARYGRISIWTLLGRMDGLLLGAILASLLTDVGRALPSTRRLSAGFAASLALGPVMLAATLLAERAWPVVGGDVQVVFSYFAVNLTFFGLVGLLVLNAGHRLLAPLRNRLLCGIGLISYGLYLYHVPIRHAVWGIGRQFGLADAHPLNTVAVVALSFGAAIASWHFIEAPLLALKDRLPYGRRLAPSPAPAPEYALAGSAEGLDREATPG